MAWSSPQEQTDPTATLDPVPDHAPGPAPPTAGTRARYSCGWGFIPKHDLIGDLPFRAQRMIKHDVALNLCDPLLGDLQAEKLKPVARQLYPALIGDLGLPGHPHGPALRPVPARWKCPLCGGHP